MTTKLTRGAQKRRLILETTLTLIAEQGVDAVTHRRVADAARVPLGSTTYYFESREHLIRDAFVHYIDEAREQHARFSAKLDAGSLESMVDLLVELTEWEFEDENRMLAEYELTLYAARDPVVAKQLHAWDALMLEQLTRALSEFGANAPADGAKTLLHLMRGYELERLSRHESDTASLRRRLLNVARGLCNG